MLDLPYFIWSSLVNVTYVDHQELEKEKRYQLTVRDHVSRKNELLVEHNGQCFVATKTKGRMGARELEFLNWRLAMEPAFLANVQTEVDRLRAEKGEKPG